MNTHTVQTRRHNVAEICRRHQTRSSADADKPARRV